MSSSHVQCGLPPSRSANIPTLFGENGSSFWETSSRPRPMLRGMEALVTWRAYRINTFVRKSRLATPSRPLRLTDERRTADRAIIGYLS